MFTRVDVIAQNDDLWSFEFESADEIADFMDLCIEAGYKIDCCRLFPENLIDTASWGKWTAQEAFDYIQENN